MIIDIIDSGFVANGKIAFSSGQMAAKLGADKSKPPAWIASDPYLRLQWDKGYAAQKHYGAGEGGAS